MEDLFKLGILHISNLTGNSSPDTVNELLNTLPPQSSVVFREKEYPLEEIRQKFGSRLLYDDRLTHFNQSLLVPSTNPNPLTEKDWQIFEDAYMNRPVFNFSDSLLGEIQNISTLESFQEQKAQLIERFKHCLDDYEQQWSHQRNE